jgi:hypothetical protein
VCFCLALYGLAEIPSAWAGEKPHFQKNQHFIAVGLKGFMWVRQACSWHWQLNFQWAQQTLSLKAFT